MINKLPTLFNVFSLLALFQAVLSANSTNNITINATNPSIAPNLNIHINMSGIGTFKIYSMSSNGHANQDTISTLHPNGCKTTPTKPYTSL